jgi:hypothetical protein
MEKGKRERKNMIMIRRNTTAVCDKQTIISAYDK